MSSLPSSSSDARQGPKRLAVHQSLISHLKIQQAALVLRSGGLVAYPTEAVWGLGCDPQNSRAIRRILTIKGRAIEKGLILVAASVEQFAPYLAGLSDADINKFSADRPVPTTWLVPDNGFAHPLVRGKHHSVALRVSAHPIVSALCAAYGGPIVSTSANFNGEMPRLWSWQIIRQMGRQLDYVLPGDLGSANKPSQIRDLLSDQILRPA
jgi:L-threonylcarbamoyladenylate synthase